MQILIAIIEISLLIAFGIIVAGDTVKIIGYMKEEIEEIRKEKAENKKNI